MIKQWEVACMTTRMVTDFTYVNVLDVLCMHEYVSVCVLDLSYLLKVLPFPQEENLVPAKEKGGHYMK